VPLLVSRVLLDVVEIFPADDQGSVHLSRDNSSGEDTAADRDLAGERAFLVCLVGSLAVPSLETTNLGTSGRRRRPIGAG
jgi:hypothetical protein